jgi:hypothetical protein
MEQARIAYAFFAAILLDHAAMDSQHAFEIEEEGPHGSFRQLLHDAAEEGANIGAARIECALSSTAVILHDRIRPERRRG